MESSHPRRLNKPKEYDITAWLNPVRRWKSRIGGKDSGRVVNSSSTKPAPQVENGASHPQNMPAMIPRSASYAAGSGLIRTTPNMRHGSTDRVLEYIAQLDVPQSLSEDYISSQTSIPCHPIQSNRSTNSSDSFDSNTSSSNSSNRISFPPPTKFRCTGQPPLAFQDRKRRKPRIYELQEGRGFFGKAQIVNHAPRSPSTIPPSRCLYSLSDACPYVGGTAKCRQQLNDLATHYADDSRVTSAITDLGFDYRFVSRRDRAMFLYLLEQARSNDPSAENLLPEGLDTIQVDELEFWDIGAIDVPVKLELQWAEFQHCLEELKKHDFCSEDLPPTRPSQFASSSSRRTTRTRDTTGHRSIREFQEVLILLENHGIDLDKVGEEDFDYLVSLPQDERAAFIDVLEPERDARKDSLVPPMVEFPKPQYRCSSPMVSRFSRCSSSSGFVSRPASCHDIDTKSVSPDSNSVSIPTSVQRTAANFKTRKHQEAPESPLVGKLYELERGHGQQHYKCSENPPTRELFFTLENRKVRLPLLIVLPLTLILGAISILVFGIISRRK